MAAKKKARPARMERDTERRQKRQRKKDIRGAVKAGREFKGGRHP